MTGPVLRIAHRAGNDPLLMPAALGLGADLLEADVFLRAGRLEVRHARSLGPVPWLWEPGRVVRDRRLLLAEVRDAAPAGAPLMLDLKGRQPALGRLVRAAMTDAPPYVVCTRHWPHLDGFADLPDVRRVTSVRTRGELALLDRRLAAHPSWGVSIHRDLLDARLTARLREQVEVVMTWPVDTVPVYERLVAHGVNGVISNDLAALPRPA